MSLPPDRPAPLESEHRMGERSPRVTRLSIVPKKLSTAQAESLQPATTKSPAPGENGCGARLRARSQWGTGAARSFRGWVRCGAASMNRNGEASARVAAAVQARALPRRPGRGALFGRLSAPISAAAVTARRVEVGLGSDAAAVSPLARTAPRRGQPIGDNNARTIATAQIESGTPAPTKSPAPSEDGCGARLRARG